MSERSSIGEATLLSDLLKRGKGELETLRSFLGLIKAGVRGQHMAKQSLPPISPVTRRNV